MTAVKGVVTRDSARDISRWFNAAAEEYGFDAVGFLAGAIAESNLDEQSFRERTWPDVSYGLFHPAVKWMGQEVAGLDRAPDGTVLDTEDNRDIARAYMSDAARAVQYAAPRYASLIRTWGDPLEAWCRWNKPNIPCEDNPNRPNYVRALERAKGYAVAQDDNVNASQEIKDKLHAVNDYAVAASTFLEVVSGDPTMAEKVLGTKGYYISSPVDGWQLHGPLPVAE